MAAADQVSVGERDRNVQTRAQIVLRCWHDHHPRAKFFLTQEGGSRIAAQLSIIFIFLMPPRIGQWRPNTERRARYSWPSAWWDSALEKLSDGIQKVAFSWRSTTEGVCCSCPRGMKKVVIKLVTRDSIGRRSRYAAVSAFSLPQLRTVESRCARFQSLVPARSTPWQRSPEV